MQFLDNLMWTIKDTLFRSGISFETPEQIFYTLLILLQMFFGVVIVLKVMTFISDQPRVRNLCNKLNFRIVIAMLVLIYIIINFVPIGQLL